MLELKPMPGGIRIEYPAGDTFKFTLKAPKKFKEGTTVRLEISQTGGIPFISKEYIPSGGRVDIALTDAEARTLLFARSHIYRVLCIYGANVARVVTGNIKIK